MMKLIITLDDSEPELGICLQEMPLCMSSREDSSGYGQYLERTRYD